MPDKKWTPPTDAVVSTESEWKPPTDALEVKKKEPIVSKSLPTQSPLLSPLQEGKNIVSGGFMKGMQQLPKIPQNLEQGVAKDKEKRNSVAGGLYNTLADSFNSLAGGLTYMAAALPSVGKKRPTDKTPEQARQTVEQFGEQFRSASSSRENEQALSKFDISDKNLSLDDIKGLAFQAPKTLLDMGIGALTGGASFFAQSVNDNAKELEKNPNASKLSSTEKLFYLYTNAAVTAALEKFSLDRVFKGSGITKKYTQKLTNEIIEDFSKRGIKATAKEIEQEAAKRAATLGQKLIRGGKRMGESIVAESSTEGLQSAAGDGVKILVNKLKGEEIFDEKDVAENFWKNTINASAAGGIFGGIIGGGGAALSNTKKGIRKQIADATTPQELEKLQNQLNREVEMGNITPQEAEAAGIKAQQYAEIAGKIPQTVPQEKKYDIIGGIEQRETIKGEIESLKEDINSTDEAFKQPKQDQLALLEGKLGQVNDYIESLVSGVEPRYEEKDGKFYKVIADGRQMQRIEIPENHYIAGKLVEEGKKQQSKTESDAVQEQTAGEVPVQSETTVSEEVEGGTPKTEPEETTVIEGDEKKVTKPNIPKLIVSDLIDKKVEFNGELGFIKQDEGGKITFENDEKIIELQGDETAKEIISPKVNVVGNTVSIDNDTYDFVSTNKDSNGNVVSVTLKDANGRTITKRDSDLALDIAIAKNNAEFNSKRDFTPQEYETKVKQPINVEFQKEFGGAALQIIESMPDEVADTFAAMEAGIVAISPDELQQMAISSAEWVDKAKKEILNSKAPQKEKNDAIKMLDKFNKDLNKYYGKVEKQRKNQNDSSEKAEQVKSVRKDKPKAQTLDFEQERKEPKEEKTFKQKDLDRAEAKRLHAMVREMDAPTDAEQVALRYLAEGGKIGETAINEVAGTVKRARLNTGEREFKSSEAKARDYNATPKEIEEAKKRGWDLNSLDKISEKLAEENDLDSLDVKNSLMEAIGNNNTRLDATKEYLERYNSEYLEEKRYKELAEKYEEEFKKEQEELQRQLRTELDEQIEGEASEEHINNLIKQYEAELKRQNQQSESEGEGDVSKPISSRESGTKTTSDEKEVGRTSGKQDAEAEAVKEKKIGKFEAKAREIAKKIEEAELPDWLKIDDKDIKKQGASADELKKLLADAVIKMGKLLDEGVEFADAIKQSVKDLVNAQGEENRGAIEKGFEKYYKGQEKSKPEVEDSNTVALKHAETEEKRRELGLPPRTLRDVKSDERLEQEADDAIRSGYDVKGLMKRILDKGHLPTDTEHIILTKYAAGLESKLENLDPNSKEFEDTFNELNQVYKASEKGGSELGAAFRARQNRVFKEDSLGEMLVREAEVNMVEELTEAQREKVVKEYEEIKKAKEEWEKKYNELAERQLEEDAKLNVQKAASNRGKRKGKEDYKKERESIKDAIKNKWKKASEDGTLMAIPIPYAKQLAAISPDVAKLMKSYAEEGITELSEIVKNIHTDIKEYVEDITEKDVRDIIAGVYNEKRTKSQIAEQLRDLRDEAKLLNQLEMLENGEMPTTERAKVERNKKITELRSKIKSLKAEMIGNKTIDGEPVNKKLKAIKTRLQKSIEELQDKLSKGDYSKEKPKEPVKLDKEAQDLKDKLIKLKQEREIRLLQQEYANRTKAEKAKDLALEVLNVPRTVMASMDFSAPLRQGIIATISHPRLAGKAFAEMFRQAFSQKRFDRWFYDLKESPVYETMEKAGLYIADPHDPKLSAKEEQFMNNLAEKIPFVGKMIKGSERAYVSYLNKMRADLFIQGMNAFEADGKTIKNSEKLYQDLASFINNSTGRGKMAKVLEDSAPLLNAAFFSPRLMASRINLLNPMYYQKLSPEVQKMAMKDMGAFLAFGGSLLALAALAGADVEDDPRSPNFGKIKIGDITYDIWGGFQQYIVELAQIVRGETKSATTGEIRSLSGKEFPFKTRYDDLEGFVRGKLAPVPAATLNVLSGKKVTGERTDILKEAKGLLTPLMIKDAAETFSKDGILSAFAVAIPSAFGVGVGKLSNIPENADKSKKEWQFVASKKVRVPEPDVETLKIGEDDRYMNKDEAEKFTKLRTEKIENSIKKLLIKGYNLEVKERVIYKKANDLTQEELKSVIDKFSRKATSEAKEELFGKKEKSDKEKKAESRAEKRNKRLGF